MQTTLEDTVLMVKSTVASSSIVKFFLFILITTLLLSLSQFTLAQVMKIRFSHGLEDYKPIVEAIYTEMGLKIEWIVTPLERGLMMVDNNSVDADLVRDPSAISAYKNIIATHELLVKATVVAWAKPGSNISLPNTADLTKYSIRLYAKCYVKTNFNFYR